MADPVTLATIGIGASAAGGGLGAISSLLSGQSQSNLYNYQAGVARINANIAQQDANYATQVGEVEAEESGMRTRAQIGETKAGIGAGNISLSSDSASRVLNSEVEVGQENEGVIRANAAKRAFGYQVAGAQDTAQASIMSTAAKTSQTAGELGAVSSIIGGIGSVSSKWLQASRSGVYSGSSGGSDSDITYSNYGFGST